MGAGMKGNGAHDEFIRHIGLGCAVVGATQDRPNTRYQLARIEGLAQIVVCAEF
jgi:hypothetical protein